MSSVLTVVLIETDHVYHNRIVSTGVHSAAKPRPNDLVRDVPVLLRERQPYSSGLLLAFLGASAEAAVEQGVSD